MKRKALSKNYLQACLLTTEHVLETIFTLQSQEGKVNRLKVARYLFNDLDHDCATKFDPRYKAVCELINQLIDDGKVITPGRGKNVVLAEETHAAFLSMSKSNDDISPGQAYVVNDNRDLDCLEISHQGVSITISNQAGIGKAILELLILAMMERECAINS